jgi:hypothetical protein
MHLGFSQAMLPKATAEGQVLPLTQVRFYIRKFCRERRCVRRGGGPPRNTRLGNDTSPLSRRSRNAPLSFLLLVATGRWL